MQRNRLKQFFIDWFWAAVWLLAIRSVETWSHSHRLPDNRAAIQMALGGVVAAAFSFLRRRARPRARVSALAPRAIPANAPTPSAEVQQYIERGRIIEAIKVYRQETGVGLKRAKDVVEQAAEAMERGGAAR